MNNIILILFLFITPLFSYGQTDYWTHMNGPFGGTIYDYSFGEDSIVYAAADNGVYKSTDNGVTWNCIGFLGNQSRVPCKTSSGSLLAGRPDIGLYRTTDEGIHWSLVFPYNGTNIFDIKEIRSDLIIMATYNGAYKSTNNGINWTQVLPNLISTSIDTSSTGEIFISTYNSGIYKSTNEGNNWTSLNGSNFGQANSVNVATNGFIFITTGNGSIYRSTNNGLNFNNIASEHQIYKTNYSVATKDNYLYVGTFYQGIWSSSDFGDTWIKQYNGERLNFFVRKLCEGRNGNVFASVTYNGAIRTTDHGVHWNGYSFRSSYTRTDFLLKANDGRILSSTSQSSFDNGLNWIYSDYDFLPISFAKNQSNGYIYAADGSTGFPSGWIYRSVNNGDDWEKIIVDSSAGVNKVYVSGNGDVYTNAQNIYKSTNNGINWIEIPALFFYSIAVNDLGYIYGKQSGGLYRSTNSGLNWQVVLPINDGNAATFITASGDIYTPGNNTLFRSTDNGDNWTQENITGPVSSIVENQSGRIFVSIYGGGVYMKAGDSWTNITYNIDNTNITCLCFNNAGQLLAGSTSYVYRTNASVIAVNNLNQDLPDKFSLSQNYPNPFNPTTHLEFGISHLGFVSLKVYDILGNEVKTLVNENKPAGSYSVEFDGSNLSSGIYFYRIVIHSDKLEAGEFTEVRKMTLIK